MATYKVIQDIEAEDKFLGPLTLKQFVFGAGGIFFAYLNVFALTKGATWAMGLFLPPMLLGFFLAIPWSKDQPTEVWVLAKLRFKFKPKKRIWDQSGMEELVTITVPKKEEKQLTNNLSQVEVKSRLTALAETIDSRGWAVKHSDIDPGYEYNAISDRLVSPSTIPQEVPAIDLNSITDPYDENTATSANFDRMIQESTTQHLADNMEKMDRARAGEPLSTINQPQTQFIPPPVVQAQPVIVPNAPDDDALSAQLKASHVQRGVATGRLRTISSAPMAQPTPPSQAQASSPTPSNPDIMNLVNNNDLSVETIQRQANKKPEPDDDPNEVTISLR